eukprot:SAG11_NODE_1615_length_4578_cov_6.001786_5_plen_80_part_00
MFVSPETQTLAEMWGPVETERESEWFCGAERGTNNTGELIGIGQALQWLKDERANNTHVLAGTPAVLLFDSCYAANMVS